MQTVTVINWETGQSIWEGSLTTVPSPGDLVGLPSMGKARPKGDWKVLLRTVHPYDDSWVIKVELEG